MSNKHTQHAQCILKKGDIKYTAWIPAVYGKVGAIVQIDFNGIWENGWVVEAVYDIMDSKYVVERSQDYKRTRQASDI